MQRRKKDTVPKCSTCFSSVLLSQLYQGVPKTNDAVFLQAHTKMQITKKRIELHGLKKKKQGVNFHEYPHLCFLAATNPGANQKSMVRMAW